MRNGALASFLFACGCAAPPAVLAPQEIVIDRDDLVIDRDTVVRPGTYRVADANGDGVLHVVGDGITVTLTGVVLDGAAERAMPDTFAGIGVSIANHEHVVIEGGAVRGFRIGVRGANANGLLLDGLDVSGNRAMRLKSTPQREDPADWLWPHENDKGEWETRYGAGISLNDCENATVRNCIARTTQNGLLLTRCRGAKVTDNDFSFLSGWGIAMYRSAHCKIVRNQCNFCVRGYSHGVYARGQDSAAILMFEQCSNNEIVGNSGTHSGDGLFLYAGHETTQRTGTGGSNDNDVSFNDFSHAVANGIEATFSRGNEFSYNRLDECDHGVWAGYSYETTIRGNTMRDCANGISIEHGHDNVIERNTIENCRVGVHLWWDDDKELLASAYGQRNNTSSSHNVVATNRIAACATPMRLDRDTDSRVEANTDGPLPPEHQDCGTGGPMEPRAGSSWFPARMPRGREHIVIGEWGPLDPRERGLVPFGTSGDAAMTFRVVGAGMPFWITSETEGFVAEPASGTAPAVIRVRYRGEAKSSVVRWSIGARIGEPKSRISSGWDTLARMGTLVVAKWTVKWWEWQTDPRNDVAEFTKLLATEPLDSTTTDELAFDWHGNAPSPKVPADHFATVAETTLTLPAGSYRITTTSDDGIRVLLDGEVILEDWTWHAPKELAVERSLTAGEHTIRVEHFELDGHAALHCAIEPIR